MGRGGWERRKKSAPEDTSCPGHVASLDFSSVRVRVVPVKFGDFYNRQVQILGRISTVTMRSAPGSRKGSRELARKVGQVVKRKWRPVGRRMSLRATMGFKRENATSSRPVAG